MLKSNDRIKLAQDVELDHVRENGKPHCKLSYKVFKEEYGYDTLLEISPYTALIQLKYFLGGIRHCVTVVCKLVFDNNYPSSISPTKDNLDYCCINDNETKVMNVLKGLLK